MSLRDKGAGPCGAIMGSVLRVMLSLPAPLMTAGGAAGDTKGGADSPAVKIADGRPWRANLAEFLGELKITLFRNGSGITNSYLTPSPTWRPTADGLCLTLSTTIRERCVTLVVRPNGYDGIEGGKVYIAFRR